MARSQRRQEQLVSEGLPSRGAGRTVVQSATLRLWDPLGRALRHRGLLRWGRLVAVAPSFSFALHP